MTLTAIAEKKDVVEISNNLDVENYIRQQFPLQDGECQVKYCKVGKNRFRINFYSERQTSNNVRDYSITRSHYVICTETEDGWEYKIR